MKKCLFVLMAAFLVYLVAGCSGAFDATLVPLDSDQDNGMVSGETGSEDAENGAANGDNGTANGDNGDGGAPQPGELREPAAFDPAITNAFIQQEKLPFLFDNNSVFADEDIYIAIVGKRLNSDEPVWLNAATNTLNPINSSYNTIDAPAHVPAGMQDWKFADFFTPLSEIQANIVAFPPIHGGKMYIAFEQPLYFHFFDDGGYAAPDLNNPDDASRGIRFEVAEFSWTQFGLWVNHSRVDAYQYPMAVEIWGDNAGSHGDDFYRKVGELLPHDYILQLWQNTVSEPFQPSYRPLDDGLGGRILQPSKIPQFKDPNKPHSPQEDYGIYFDYFDDYVNAVWDKYQSETLRVHFGDLGLWEGSVQGDVFVMNGPQGQQGRIEGRPDTQEVIEGKYRLAQGGENDKNVQKFFSASFNRGVIDLDAEDGAIQNWANSDFYFQTDNHPAAVHNEYVEFWHNSDISYRSETYAFAYDDVYEHSSTLQVNEPERVRITIGGFWGLTMEPNRSDY